MQRVFRKPEKWKIFWKNFWAEADKQIIGSITIVSITSIFIGAAITIQTANNIVSPLIPKFYVGVMARESLALEFCSTMIALMLAGKIGSQISSEIGSMRITEQIDAMEIMGVNSANYLILPKVTSATIFGPFIMLLSFFIGLIGAGLMVHVTQVVTVAQFIAGLRHLFKMFYIFYSMIKMSVFCFLITSLSAYFGYCAKGGSLGVGRSSTQGIVVSSTLILVFDLILTKLLL